VSASGSISSSVKVVAAQQLSLSRSPDAPYVWEKVRLGLGLCLSSEERAENSAYERGFAEGVAQRFEELCVKSPPLIG
jgi:hypothetical protein